MITFQDAKPEDIGDITRIYLEGFPGSTRFYLGYKTCEAYFRQVLKHDSYSLMTASQDHEIVGFVLFTDNLLNTVKRRTWLFRDPPGVVRFLLSHPVYALKRFIYRTRTLISGDDSLLFRPASGCAQERGCCIETVAVAERARNLGIGRDLVARCIDMAREREKDYVDVTVEDGNAAAKNLYRSIGFGPVFYDKYDKTDVFSMILNKGAKEGQGAGVSGLNS